jgi:hypothetical protein
MASQVTLALGLAVLSFCKSAAALVAVFFMCCLFIRFGVIFSQELWYRSTPASMQGRVFGVRNIVKKFSYVSAYMLAGWYVATFGVKSSPDSISYGFLQVGGLNTYLRVISVLAVLVLVPLTMRLRASDYPQPQLSAVTC